MTDMPSLNPISAVRVGHVAALVANMMLAQKEQVIDDLFHEHPTLLACAAVVTKSGVSGEV